MKIYDAKDLSKSIVKTFKDREPEWHKRFKFSWPKYLQNVGDSLAVAYSSDKWETGKEREFKAYKHLAESRNFAFVKPGLLVRYDDHQEEWPVFGPMVSFDRYVMPDSIAVLGYFEEANFLLYIDDEKHFPKEDDDGIVKVTIRHAMLGGSKFKYKGESKYFLVVYTETQGVLIIITGVKLGIEKDGIVG